MHRKYKYGFEKLTVWQSAKHVAVLIYKLTENFPKSEMYGLVSQMRRAAISIASNIAEGSTRDTKNDQARFYQIAFGSAIELTNQLMISQEIGYLNHDTFVEVMDELSRISFQINKLKSSALSSKYLREEGVEYGVNTNPDELHLEFDSNATAPNPSQPLSTPLNPSQPYYAHDSAVIDSGAQIGLGTKIWHFCHIMPGAVIGK
ncbi:MAG: four helix bundle protein, partial [Bacteroidetes bacterium]